ncbi:MAG TPA: hypothetical protein GX401_07050 [Clostridiales bacterium]|nr:hypothetical protein [Clostridiales bacterium]
MLCVKPTENLSLEKDILSKCAVMGKEPRLITAVEDNEILGYIAVDLILGEERIIAFNISGCENYDHPTGVQWEIADYLIRTAGNYAMNRGVVKLTTDLESKFTLFRLFKFTELDNKFTVYLKDLFKKCENCS